MASVQLSIAEPCHENWDAMLPEEKGRFCLSCQKMVVDFTQMSDRQVFDYFKNYQGNTCGQLSPSQLDREITKPKTHSIGRWKYFWQVLLPAVFAFHKVEAQKLKGEIVAEKVCKPLPQQVPQVVMGKIMAPLRQPVYQIKGTITDEQNNPLVSASITSGNDDYKISDSLGQFSAILGKNGMLTISYVGFETQQLSLDSIKTQANSRIFTNKASNSIDILVPIQLKRVVADSSNVVVAGYIDKVLRGSLGGISVIKRSTIFSRPKLVNKPDDLPKLSIYPNPISLGQDFQISLQVKNVGNFVLQIVDASGKVLLIEKFSVTNLHLTKTIRGNALQQPGIYFINILNGEDKKGKMITGKIVVQ